MNRSIRAGAALAAVFAACAVASVAVAAKAPSKSGPPAGAKPIVLVVGATGRTGGAAVAQLVEQGRMRVRALVRDPSKPSKLPSDVDVIKGDLRDGASLATALKGATYVISAAGSHGDFFGDNRPELVDYQGVRDLATAAKAAGVKRLCLVSSMGVTHSEHPMNKAMNGIMDWKLKGENALRASGVSYTIVRPGGLRDEPGGKAGVKTSQGDVSQGEGFIPRADVASACIAALDLKAADRVTFEVVSAPGTPPADWAKVYAGLQADPR
jgi:uncharacterized protein YbjT (DUF2867 family)